VNSTDAGMMRGPQIGRPVPLYNTNTPVAAAVGRIALGEWQAVQPGRLLLAAAFITGGGVLAATSTR